MQTMKAVDLKRLESELAAAGIAVSALGTYQPDPDGQPDLIEVHTYDAEGAYLELPPEAQAVLDAHMAGGV